MTCEDDGRKEQYDNEDMQSVYNIHTERDAFKYNKAAWRQEKEYQSDYTFHASFNIIIDNIYEYPRMAIVF